MYFTARALFVSFIICNCDIYTIPNCESMNKICGFHGVWLEFRDFGARPMRFMGYQIGYKILGYLGQQV